MKYKVKFVYEIYVEAENETEAEEIVWDSDFKIESQASNCYVDEIEEVE